MKRRLIIITLILLILAGGAGFGGRYMLDYALKPQALVENRDVQASFLRAFDSYPFLMEWTDSLLQADALGDLYMENDEGTRLHAYYLNAPEPTGKTAIVVHGYTDNAISVMQIAYIYNKVMGFNVLMPELYGHGLSEGDAAQMGWLDRLDVLLWMETAEEMFGSKEMPVRMVVHGVSMGAATTMMVAGEVEHGLHQLPYAKCFVEDCGYTSVWDEFGHELWNRFYLPSFPLLNMASFFCNRQYGWNFQQASALEAVKRSTRPMLFIHGEADDYVPTRMVYPLYEAHKGPKELWTLPDVGHADAFKSNPEEYTRRVKAFVEKYIN
ncbi:MAG: alpha/beta hydrolase [Bacteroides sp.]|nr:alpha/beta hydrolase [Bacteroides sp.]